MNWELFFLILGGLAFLIVGGEFLVRGASQLAATLGVPPMIIGLTIVAFGTSSPELAVSLKAAFSGNVDIAVSNVVGSNIFNVLFILGISALISPLLIHSQMIKREVPIMFGSSLLFYLLSIDNQISRLEGSILFALILAYTAWLIIEAKKHKKENQELETESEKEFENLKNSKRPVLMSIIYLVLGLFVIMFGAEWLVKGATQLAQFFGVSDTVIGLTIVAAGTSLPEVVASIMATIKGERDIAVGNVIGSNIYNLLAILGLSGAISPIGLSVNSTLLKIDIPVMLGVALICYIFFRTKHTLSRVEGAIFFVGYVSYTTYLISQTT